MPKRTKWCHAHHCSHLSGHYASRMYINTLTYSLSYLRLSRRAHSNRPRSRHYTPCFNHCWRLPHDRSSRRAARAGSRHSKVVCGSSYW